MTWAVIATFFLFVLLAFHNDMCRGSLRRGHWPLPPPPPSGIEQQPQVASGSSQSPNSESDTFYPSIAQVLQVRDILRRLGPKETGLPTEMVDMIIDEAEYWPSVETSIKEPFSIRKDGDRECLRSPPLCYDPKESKDDSSTPTLFPHRGMHPCRKIVFAISSHDQGWGGERAHKGTYRGSYTWFDAYPISSKQISDGRQQQNEPSGPSGRTEKSENITISTLQEETEHNSTSTSNGSFLPDHLTIPTSSKLQINRTATATTQYHHIVWHCRDNVDSDSEEAEIIERETGRGRQTLNGQAVRDLKVGDAVAVWARARFDGWVNHIVKMSVRVFWAV